MSQKRLRLNMSLVFDEPETITFDEPAFEPEPVFEQPEIVTFDEPVFDEPEPIFEEPVFDEPEPSFEKIL